MTKILKKRSFLARLRNYFITGIVVLVPIGITLYLTTFFISISSNLIPKEINPNSYLPFQFLASKYIIDIIYYNNRMVIFIVYWKKYYSWLTKH